MSRPGPSCWPITALTVEGALPPVVRSVFTRWILSSMGSPPSTEMLSIVPSMVSSSHQRRRSRRSDWRRHRKTTPRYPSYDGPRLRNRDTSLYLRELARGFGERLSTRCDGPEGIGARIRAISYFIQPDTEEEVVCLRISFHSRNAFPASGKRVAGRGRDHRHRPRCPYNQ